MDVLDKVQENFLHAREAPLDTFEVARGRA